MFEQAKSEALRALDVFEKLGAANDVELIRRLLGQIDRDARGDGLGSGHIYELDDDGELLEAMLFVVSINSSCLGGVIDLSRV